MAALLLVIAILLQASFCSGRYYADRQPEKNCVDVLRSGGNKNGVYKIDPDSKGAFWVYCDQTTDGGGWAVILNRMDGSEDFSRTWDEYKVGFGDLGREHWLGLDNIHRLTQQTRNELRVDLEDFSKKTAYAEYNHFYVSDQAGLYKLTVGSYSGTAGDSLIRHNGMKFTTKDWDNDVHGNGKNCAKSYGDCGWWFEACYSSYLTGPYHHGNIVSTNYLNWKTWSGKHSSLKKAQMKIRPLLH